MNRRSLLRTSLLGSAAIVVGGGTAGYASYAINPFYVGPMSDHFDGTRFFVPGVEYNNTLAGVLRWKLSTTPAQWPKAYPSPHNDKPPAQVGKGELRVTLIGHASFLLQADHINVLIDPVFSERCSPVSFAGPTRVNPPGVAFADLPEIHAVLVTHGHYDHLDVATLSQLQQRFAPQFATPLGNDKVITSAIGDTAKIIAMDWGHTTELGNGMRIHLEPSYHWSARGALDRRKQLWGSFVIETTAGKIYHIGDTGYIDGQFFRDVKAKHGAIKLAMIPIGAYEPRWFMEKQHVNPADAVKILQDCGAEFAIGHHWGTFQLTDEAIDDPPKHLAEALQAANIEADRFQPFRPGQSLSLRALA